MPDRILTEELLTSPAVNALSCAAEVFYRRLMSVVDDAGRFDARPEVLRERLYARRSAALRVATVAEWLGECVAAGLMAVADVDGRPVLTLADPPV